MFRTTCIAFTLVQIGEFEDYYVCTAVEGNSNRVWEEADNRRVYLVARSGAGGKKYVKKGRRILSRLNEYKKFIFFHLVLYYRSGFA